MKQVLHVGCGITHPGTLHQVFRNPSWKEIRLDIDPGVKPDIVSDMLDMKPVENESVDAVWSSHNLEHLHAHEVPKALSEFHRVLKPEGFVLIRLPDIQAVAAEVAKGNLEGPLYQSPAGPICAIDILWGLRAAIARGNSFMTHKTGFTRETLGKKLKEAGFSLVEVKGQRFDLWAIGYKSEPKNGHRRITLGGLLAGPPEAHGKYFQQAVQYRQAGQFEKAEQLFLHVLKNDPGSAAAHHEIGAMALQLGKTGKAIHHFEQALAGNPGNPHLFVNLGGAKQSLGLLDEALAHYDEAIRIVPDLPAAICGKANVFMKKGDFEAAYQVLLPHIGKKTSNIAVAFSQVAGKFGKRKQAIDLVLDVLKREGLRREEAADLHFAVGKLLDEEEEYDRAFHHFRRGNSLRPWKFQPEQHKKYIDNLIARTGEQAGKMVYSTRDTELPVFILGMPRSGTSLVEQILSSHPKVFGAGELGDIGHMACALHEKMGVKTPYPDCLHLLDTRMLDQLADQYISRLRGFSNDAERITDKMPLNFLGIGFIRQLFPKARIIHCHRNPLDTCVSIYFQDFHGAHPYATDLSNLAVYYREYIRVMKHFQETLEIDMLHVRYEDLVKNTEEVSQRMVEYIGLEWNDNCLRFYETERPVITSSYQQVRKPIYHKSIGRFKHYEKYLKPLIDGLKDPVSTGSDLERMAREGARFFNIGKNLEAERVFRKILEKDPNYFDAIHFLGVMALKRNELQKAKELLEKGLRIRPGAAGCRYNLGYCLAAMHRLEDAEREYREAIRLDPNHANAYTNLGNVLRDQGRFEEAIESYRNGIRLDSRLVEAIKNCGVVLQEMGRIDEAREMCLKALQVKPDFAEMYRLLSFMGKFSSPDDEIAKRIQKEIGRPGLKEEDAMHLRYALGKVYDDCGRYEEAFAHYRKANDIRKKSAPFDIRETERMVDRLIAVFDRDLLAAKSGLGSDSELPVFIVGMPRSGTTLVEQIVASHPLASGAGELNSIQKAVARIPGIEDGKPYPECLRSIEDPSAFLPLIRMVESRLKRDASDRAIRITDKMPFNFMHVGLISLLFPKARIIHCRRHPYDVCLSNFFQYYPSRMNHFTYDLERLRDYYIQYLRVTDHWKSILGDRIFEVQYEKLVAAPDVRFRELIDYAGLPWNDACLEFHKAKSVIQTASSCQVRQPIYKSSVHRYKHYETFLGPLKEIPVPEELREKK